MRNLIIIFLFLCVSLLSLTLFVGVTKINPKIIFTKKEPHLYDNKNISIEKISLTIFYFVPKDNVDKKKDNWKEVTEQHLKDLTAFHELQFNNLSKISYDFFPEIIIGDKTAKEYESLFEYDDHSAIVPVKEEINTRVLSPSGNLHPYLKEDKGNNTRKVYLIVFEGNGAAGSDDFCFISRSYLTEPLYKEDGSTYLAHEFYHTLGLLDNYKTSSYVYKDNQQTTVSLVTNKDIMGQVNIPIFYTYIDKETLKKMGL